MSKKLVLEIDGSVFYSEDDLVNYIRKKYVNEYSDADVFEVYEFLKKNYPDWEVKVVNSEGWLSDYRIHLTKDKTSIEQYFGNTKANNDECPTTFEGLLSDINCKIKIIQRITDKIKLIHPFEDVYCSEFNYGYTSDEHCFTFLFKIRGTNKYKEVSFFPWGKDSDENEFINNLKKFYVNKLEGEVAPRKELGYLVGYTIDGVEIYGLLERARVARLEIIE